ncbi:MAG: hypothetical protein Q4B50_01385 [Bacillota bacterium]|nr:hypothetical protein [Bacillota bacterium]
MPLQKHEIRTLVIIGLLLLSLLLYMLLSQTTLEKLVFSQARNDEVHAVQIQVRRDAPDISWLYPEKDIPADSLAYAELRQFLGEIRLRPCIIPPQSYTVREGECYDFLFYTEEGALRNMFTIYGPKHIFFSVRDGERARPKAYRIISKTELEEIMVLLERHDYDSFLPEPEEGRHGPSDRPEEEGPRCP